MTTIAYRAGFGMASDTQATCGTAKRRACKVKRLACGGLMGGAGKWADLMKVARWADAGFPPDSHPDFGEDGGEFEALIVKGDGTVYLLDDCMELMPFTDEFIAIGSGECYAVAAMHCGRTPAEAVEVAGIYDAMTSAPVEVFQLEAPAPKPKAKARAKAK